MADTQERPVSRHVAESVLDQIYIALYDSRERIGVGTDSITQCINYLEGIHGYSRPRDSRPKEVL